MFSALSTVESRPTPIVWLSSVNLNSPTFPWVVSCNSGFDKVSYVCRLYNDGNQNILDEISLVFGNYFFGAVN